jgi:hypothetical protein
LRREQRRSPAAYGGEHDPHPVIRGLFSAPHLLPFIHVGSGGGAEPQPFRLPRRLSQKGWCFGNARVWAIPDVRWLTAKRCFCLSYDLLDSSPPGRRLQHRTAALSLGYATRLHLLPELEQQRAVLTPPVASPALMRDNTVL